MPPLLMGVRTSGEIPATLLHDPIPGRGRAPDRLPDRFLPPSTLLREPLARYFCFKGLE